MCRRTTLALELIMAAHVVDTAPENPLTLLNMIVGYWVGQSIYVSAKLDIAGILKDGAQSISDLARRTGANQDALYRLLRALASVRIFKEEAHGCFAMTPLAEYLRSDHPISMRPMTILASELQYHA